MRQEPTSIDCKECGKSFQAKYDFRTGILKSKICPSCQYHALVEKAKKKLGAKKVSDKPNKSDRKTNRKKTKKRSKQRTNKLPVLNNRTLENRLDEVWSKLVKAKAGYVCEYCEKPNTLNSHHLYSRAKKSVRWDTDNGICLCVAHHVGNSFSAHKTSLEFTEWVNDYKGKKFMERLKIKSHNTGKYSRSEKELMLFDLKRQLTELQNKSS